MRSTFCRSLLIALLVVLSIAAAGERGSLGAELKVPEWQSALLGIQPTQDIALVDVFDGIEHWFWNSDPLGQILNRSTITADFGGEIAVPGAPIALFRPRAKLYISKPLERFWASGDLTADVAHATLHVDSATVSPSTRAGRDPLMAFFGVVAATQGAHIPAADKELLQPLEALVATMEPQVLEETSTTRWGQTSSQTTIAFRGKEPSRPVSGKEIEIRSPKATYYTMSFDANGRFAGASALFDPFGGNMGGTRSGISIESRGSSLTDFDFKVHLADGPAAALLRLPGVQEWLADTVRRPPATLVRISGVDRHLTRLHLQDHEATHLGDQQRSGSAGSGASWYDRFLDCYTIHHPVWIPHPSRTPSPGPLHHELARKIHLERR